MDEARLLALLHWYAAMGVDEAVADAPADWAGMRAPALAIAPAQAQAAPRAPPQAQAGSPAPAARTPAARSQQPHAVDEFDAPPPWSEPPPPRMPPTAPLRRAPPLPPDEAVLDARARAGAAANLAELLATLQAFDGCGLKATAKSLCFYRGAPTARLMLIGEAPGRDEDLEGRPFVGRAGQLLDKMLAAISLDEASVHITNVVYWRPPGNRTPTPHEAQVCQPFLARQIELVGPDVLVLLGGAAAKQVLDTPEGIMRLRGRWREYQAGERAIPAMATLHPAYLLRTPAAKRLAWRDLMAVHEALQRTG